MIRALILCVLVAGVLFVSINHAESQVKTFAATATLPSPLEQRIEALEKRVEALEKGGILVESLPAINPHPFGTEPDK